MLFQVVCIFHPLSVCQCHNEHIATFFQRLGLVETIGMAGGIWKMSSEIVHRIHVGILARLLVFGEGVEHEFGERRLQVHENGKEREYDIHGLGVSIGRYFLEKEVLLCQVSDELCCSECLADGKGGDCEVVGTACCD